ncbi:MAG: hypothetical protein ACREOK_02120 [Gemmatimonadaceae bacterium]
MRYSLWNNDILIGHTELSYHVCIPEHRMGELAPTDAGLAILQENEHLDEMRLQLRDEGGRVIPTEHISTQDANRLARLGREAMESHEFDDEELDEETRAAIEHDAALIEEWMAQREPDDLWNDYDDEDAWDESKPFYQVFVHLRDPNSIPWVSDVPIEDSTQD